MNGLMDSIIKYLFYNSCVLANLYLNIKFMVENNKLCLSKILTMKLKTFLLLMSLICLSVNFKNVTPLFMRLSS